MMPSQHCLCHGLCQGWQWHSHPRARAGALSLPGHRTGDSNTGAALLALPVTHTGQSHTPTHTCHTQNCHTHTYLSHTHTCHTHTHLCHTHPHTHLSHSHTCPMSPCRPLAVPSPQCGGTGVPGRTGSASVPSAHSRAHPSMFWFSWHHGPCHCPQSTVASYSEGVTARCHSAVSHCCVPVLRVSRCCTPVPKVTCPWVLVLTLMVSPLAVVLRMSQRVVIVPKYLVTLSMS